MNLSRRLTPNRWIGGNRMEVIVIHWWDDPSKKPSLGGVVNWLTNAASQVSAHYVVSGNTVYQLAEENDITWHARDANPFSIGIEVDPNTPTGTYETLGKLVRDIRSRRGSLPLKRHSDYVQTGCPGSIDIDRIDRESMQASKGETMVDSHQLNVIFRLRLGRSPDASAKKTYIGKPFNTVDASVRASKEYKERVERIKRTQEVSTGDLDQGARQALGNATLVKKGTIANAKTLSKGIYEVK